MIVNGESVMSLRIVEFESNTSESHSVDQPALVNTYEHIQQSFRYWRGASGRRYLHTIYSLLDCPILPKANYILVRINNDGSRTAVRVGRTVEDACSLNLAYLRQKAAQLGASEIHIHLLPENCKERFIAEMDLRAGLFFHLGAEPNQRPVAQSI